jgi:bifunctional non-homologous end joining protein LigD
MAKDGSSPYVHSRSSKWLKFKCVREQGLVVGGFTDITGRSLRSCFAISRNGPW